MTRADNPRRTGVGIRTLRTARGLMALGIGEVVGKLATLALIVGAARALGPAEFGEFSFALALGTLVAIVASWGMDTVVVQQGSLDPDRLPVLLAELLVLRAVLAAAVLVVAGGVGLGGGAGGLAALLVLVACLVDTHADAFRAAATARQAQGRCAAVQIVQRVVGAALVLTALLTGGGLLAVAVGYLTGSVVGLLGMALAVRSLGITPSWRAVSGEGVRRLGRDARVLGISAVVSMALFRIDMVLLGLLATDAVVGVYAAAYRLLETVLFVAWAVSRALFPVVASDASVHRIRRGLDRGVAILATLFVPYAALLWLRGDELLELLYGDGFAAAATPILHLLAAAPLAFGLAYLAADVLLARGPNPRILLGSAIALAVNVAANLALIPALGGIGAAAATTGSYLVEAIVLGWLAHRQIGRLVRAGSFVGSFGATAVAAAVLAAPAPLAVALPLAVAGFALVWWALNRLVDPEQVDVVRRLVGGAR